MLITLTILVLPLVKLAAVQSKVANELRKAKSCSIMPISDVIDDLISNDLGNPVLA